MNHEWHWSENAPEIDVPEDQRVTSTLETCKHCKVNTARGPTHRIRNPTWKAFLEQRFLLCRPTGMPQPVCPETCEETLAVKHAFEEVDSRSSRY